MAGLGMTLSKFLGQRKRENSLLHFLIGYIKRLWKEAEDYEVQIINVRDKAEVNFKGSSGRLKNSICGISTAAEAIAEAAVEMPRMLFSQ